MTRVLQIRRGTTAANDNFTGMVGEVTFDTEAKTLRVHDGAARGGYALARADQLGDGGQPSGASDFDINNIPEETWRELFAIYGGVGIVRIVESGLCSIANVAQLEYNFDAGINPKIAVCALVCQSADAGYESGDTAMAFGIGGRANPAPNVNGTAVRLMVGGESFWVSHNSTGVQTNITNAKWKLKFIAVTGDR